MKIGTLKLRTLTSIAAITFSSLSIVLPAQAQNVFTEDFQDGNSDGWAGSPQDGDIRLSKYQENVSLKMTGNAYALRKIDNISAKHIEISGSFAAENLNTDDSCKLEASADGKTWHEIGRVTDGQDDAVTLHRLFGTMGVEGTVFLGIRADGQSDTATCWTDNIKISGIRNINTLAADVPHGVLWGGTALIEPLSTHAFTPPEDINAPRARFTGTLNFAGEKADHFELLKDDFKYTDTADSLPRLPGFSFDLVHNDIDLIPVQRGPQPSSHPDWEWILEPGKIWTLASGQVSVSLPFALQERNANCIHNGVMAFEIDASGAASNMVYQIGSETCAYIQLNLRGSSAINFEY